MQDIVNASIQGFVKILDKDTKEILVDTHNDVLYGNISTALAHALIGNPNSFLFYLAFGNGAAYIDTPGTISYRPSFGGPGSLIKNPSANLYNTVYVKKLSNDSTTINYDPLSRAYIPAGNLSTNFEDIIVEVTLGYNEPPIGIAGVDIVQNRLDNSPVVGEESFTSPVDGDMMVFNEIGLFAGSNNIFPGNATTTIDELNQFINSFTGFPGTNSKIMLTHAIFHPIQKSLNRSLEFIYTLRIQMGSS